MGKRQSKGGEVYTPQNCVSVRKLMYSLKRQIDDLEWEGDFKRADFLRTDLAHVTELDKKGDVWFPSF